MPLPRRESQEAAVPWRRRVRRPPSPPWPPGPLRTAMRMSVIFKSDGIEFRLTFWGYASRSAKRPSPATAAPVPRSERRPIAFSFVDIYSPFRHQNLLASGNGSFSHHIRYPKLNLEADALPRFNPSSTASPARLRWCSQVAWTTSPDGSRRSVEFAPAPAVLSRGKAERWPAAGWGGGRQSGERDPQNSTQWAGDGSEWRFCRQRFLRRGNPACGSIRNCGGFRPKCERS